MTSLVIFYSRTGTTKRVANTVSEKLSCDCEEIFDTKNRLGFFGWLRSGKDAMMKKLTILKEINKNPESYDLIIIGTPIWSSNMSTPIRTYITDNKDKLKNVAFFCTEGSRGGEKCFKKMAILCDKEPVATLEIKKKDIKKEIHLDKINAFIQEIK
ncbi:MAG: flavodoxin family protein [Candidatus Hodarchaeota archaeon]